MIIQEQVFQCDMAVRKKDGIHSEEKHLKHDAQSYQNYVLMGGALLQKRLVHFAEKMALRGTKIG